MKNRYCPTCNQNRNNARRLEALERAVNRIRNLELRNIERFVEGEEIAPLIRRQISLMDAILRDGLNGNDYLNNPLLGE